MFHKRFNPYIGDISIVATTFQACLRCTETHQNAPKSEDLSRLIQLMELTVNQQAGAFFFSFFSENFLKIEKITFLWPFWVKSILTLKLANLDMNCWTPFILNTIKIDKL
ncbi:hypothetical protein BpHYR1_001934 [Brachionus plicatilis]|uniref:Uncharacterized protein n=1 Tax=Brachionus plicatilis TaxID=10195 RepID=A0A3M7RRV3_BRAPC|nr:hypothetical protein BpHYR1_001934 [Brachionus plicatilis]